MTALLAQLPLKVRYTLYIVFLLLWLGYGAYNGAQGNWAVAIPAFLTAVVQTVAASCTGKPGLFKIK